MKKLLFAALAFGVLAGCRKDDPEYKKFKITQVRVNTTSCTYTLDDLSLEGETPAVLTRDCNPNWFVGAVVVLDNE